MKRLLLCTALLMAGCASLPNPYGDDGAAPPRDQSVETAPRQPAVSPPEPPMDQPPANSAVLALATRARGDFERGRLAAASQTLERALRIAPEDPQAWLMLGWVRLAQQQPDQAAALVGRALSFRTSFAQQCLAQALREVSADREGGWPEAWRLYRQAAKQCTPEPV